MSEADRGGRPSRERGPVLELIRPDERPRVGGKFLFAGEEKLYVRGKSDRPLSLAAAARKVRRGRG